MSWFTFTDNILPFTIENKNFKIFNLYLIYVYVCLLVQIYVCCVCRSLRSTEAGFGSLGTGTGNGGESEPSPWARSIPNCSATSPAPKYIFTLTDLRGHQESTSSNFTLHTAVRTLIWTQILLLRQFWPTSLFWDYLSLCSKWWNCRRGPLGPPGMHVWVLGIQTLISWLTQQVL